MQAKVCSKITMFFAGVWIAALTILKAKHCIDIEITDVIYSGIAIAAVWSPTYFSIFLDKIKEIRFGDSKE